MLKKIECMGTWLICLTTSLFLLKSAIPVINDLYWAFLICLLMVTITLFFIKKVSMLLLAKYILEILRKSKSLLLLLLSWISCDFLNMLYAREGVSWADIYSFSIAKYFSLLQVVFLFLAIGIISYGNSSASIHIFRKIEKTFVVLSVIGAIFVIFNYCYPIVHTEYYNQVSLAKDWNIFGTYFIVAYIVTQLYLYNLENLSCIKKVSLMAIDMCLIMQIVLLSVSRRTLILFVICTVLILIYIIISEWTNCEQKKIKFLNTVCIVIVLIMDILVATALNGVIVSEVNNKLSAKLERINIVSERTSIKNISKELVDNILEFSKQESSVESENKVPNKIVSENENDNNNNVQEAIPPVEEKKEQTKVNTPIENRLETYAVGGGFFSDRIVLFREAFNEIKSYELCELLVGKGTYHSYLMYKEEPHFSILMEAGFSAEDKTTPHNYLIQDFLEGGLIKFSVSIMFTILFGIKLLKLCFKNKEKGILPIWIMSIVFFNISISGSVGFIGDRYFQIVFLIYIYLNGNQLCGAEN